MTNVKITVGGAIEDEAARRFVNAWHRAERGESFRERHLAFESWDALARVLTGKRMELLRYVHGRPVASVRALAKALGRDYSNVHSDVKALTAAGLLETAEGGLRADYDAIETRIAIWPRGRGGTLLETAETSRDGSPQPPVFGSQRTSRPSGSRAR